MSVGAILYASLTPQEDSKIQDPTTYTVSLKHLPVQFEIPKGYVALEEEGFEGGYGAHVRFGKQASDGYAYNTGMQIFFTPSLETGEYDAVKNHGVYVEPGTYIDLVLNKKIPRVSTYKPFSELTIFGNKAARYTEEVMGETEVVAFLKQDQITAHYPEFRVDSASGQLGMVISSASFGSGVPVDDALLNSIVSSIRLKK